MVAGECSNERGCLCADPKQVESLRAEFLQLGANLLLRVELADVDARVAGKLLDGRLALVLVDWMWRIGSRRRISHQAATKAADRMVSEIERAET